MNKRSDGILKKTNQRDIRIRELEEDNTRNNKILHMLEIKREIKIVRTDIEIIKSDIKIILQLIQEKKDTHEKSSSVADDTKEENTSWWFS